jgi:sugar-specific transcriptional regulator TrmB
MTDPTAALQRLGLSEYEAEAFVALQQIDSGSASDVAEVSNVPRSQVYGAADDLEDRGLLDVQQTTPKRYRAVSLEEAREQLRREFEREQEQAFDALAEIEPDFADGDERQEAIWTVRGREGIDARVESFLADAKSSITFGSEAALLASHGTSLSEHYRRVEGNHLNPRRRTPRHG